MKKLLPGVIVLAFMLSLLTFSAYAVNGRQRGRDSNCRVTCSVFIDEDGDGICDNCPNDGVCQYNGIGRGLGRGARSCRGCCRVSR